MKNVVDGNLYFVANLMNCQEYRLNSAHTIQSKLYCFRTNEGRFFTETDATLESILGYISSLSAVSKLTKAEGREAAESFINKCKQR